MLLVEYTTISKKPTKSHPEKITEADWVRFHELAEATLRRSNRAYFATEIGRSISWIWIGGLPIVGLLYLGWSAREWLVFLLAGAGTGIILDIFKLYFLNRQIMDSANAAYENNFVWTMVDALRQGEDMAPRDHLRARYQPKMGIVVDVIFGTVGALMTIGLFPEDLFAAFDTSTLLWSVSGMVAYRVAFTAWEIIEQRASGTQDRAVRVAVGLRGVGLFLLGFLVGFIVGDPDQPHASGEPDLADALLVRGRCHLALGHLQAAVADADAALRLVPQSASAVELKQSIAALL